MIMVVLVAVMLMGAPVAGGKCDGAVFVAVGDCWTNAAAAAAAAVVVVVSVARGHREAVLAVGAGGASAGRLGRRGRRLAEGRVQVLVSAELWFVVHISVVNQRDVVDEVVDEELRVGHEVVDGVAGFWFLPALVQWTTECFHHSHLPKQERWGRDHKKKRRRSNI